MRKKFVCDTLVGQVKKPIAQFGRDPRIAENVFSEVQFSFEPPPPPSFLLTENFFIGPKELLRLETSIERILLTTNYTRKRVMKLLM